MPYAVYSHLYFRPSQKAAQPIDPPCNVTQCLGGQIMDNCMDVLGLIVMTLLAGLRGTEDAFPFCG